MIDAPRTIWLIDTSALARMRAHLKIAETVYKLIDDGSAATCITIDLEVGRSAQTTERLKQSIAERAKNFRKLPLSEPIEKRAIKIQLLMAERGLHRAAGLADILTAAIAEYHYAAILHYDADFEHIASVTGQRQQWIAPRGSIS